MSDNNKSSTQRAFDKIEEDIGKLYHGFKLSDSFDVEGDRIAKKMAHWIAPDLFGDLVRMWKVYHKHWVSLESKLPAAGKYGAWVPNESTYRKTTIAHQQPTGNGNNQQNGRPRVGKEGTYHHMLGCPQCREKWDEIGRHFLP